MEGRSKFRWSLGFGLERIGVIAHRHPRIAAIGLSILIAVTAYGVPRVSVDRDLRDLFRGETDAYETYVAATAEFVDPENQFLVLIEGQSIGSPATLERLFDLHLELQLLPEAGSVFSLFSLRTPPDAYGNSRPLVDHPVAGLTPALLDAIRAHPIFGSRLISEDASALLFVVSHAEPKASLEQHEQLIASAEPIIDQALAGTDLTGTITGFAALRTEIVKLLLRDQLVLNGSGLIIGFLLSLILFRSVRSAVLTAFPAALAGLSIIGWSAALGIPVTILSNVVPALVMVLGYADGLHLTAAWRRYRDLGHSSVEAERLALEQVAPAVVLTALTTAVAFLSMILSDIRIVRDFGWVGAFGVVVGTWIVLIGHGLAARLLGKIGRPSKDVAVSPLGWLAGPCERLTARVAAKAWPIAVVSLPLTVLFVGLYLAVPPVHSVRETLPAGTRASHALDVIDAELGGAYPIQIVLPLGGLDPDSPEAIDLIRAVHEAVAAVSENPPLSLWSLGEWASTTSSERGATLALGDLPPETQRQFVSEAGALVTVYVRDVPTVETNQIIDRLEVAATTVAPDALVTGVTVLGAREAARTISGLSLNLGLAIVVALLAVAVALRSAAAGLVAAIPNILPIAITGGLLYFLGAGMQLSSVVSLTLAFGIALDDTIHYLSALSQETGTLPARMRSASRKVGPVLIASTLVIVTGLLMTLTSGLASVQLFGLLAIVSLVAALIGDLVVLPAIIAGPARRLYRASPEREAQRKTIEAPPNP